MEGLATKADEDYLDNGGEYEDDDEEPIVEEALEDVVLSRFDLSRVDLVEELHEHEGVEEHCVVNTVLQGPFLRRLLALHLEDLFTKE